MTDTLLIIIDVLLAVRIVLQVRQGKRAFEKMYQATSEVENWCYFVPDETWDNICDQIISHGERGYELVSVQSNVVIDGDTGTMLFFTRKKIKNFLEE